jgi:NitT/TauT family transport system permease protein
MSSKSQARLEAMAAAARRQRRLQAWLPWMVLIGAFILWEVLVEVFGISTFILPAPTDVWGPRCAGGSRSSTTAW